jgi:integrase/recombinase XerC
LLQENRIRHSVITAALDATGGDLRKVQKLSRHVNLIEYFDDL